MRQHIRLPAVLIAFIYTAAFAQGVRTWYGNDTFMQELDTAISSFFGDSIGTYVRNDNYGHVDAAKQAEQIKIANQFLSIFGHGGPGMQELPDRNMLYEYFAPHDGYIRVAVVTPQTNTSILAAAITHFTCGYISMKDIHNAVAVQSNYTGEKCNKPTVTIFFKNKASVDWEIRTELMKWGKSILLGGCQASNAVRAKDGIPPQPCRARINIVTLTP